MAFRVGLQLMVFPLSINLFIISINGLIKCQEVMTNAHHTFVTSSSVWPSAPNTNILNFHLYKTKEGHFSLIFPPYFTTYLQIFCVNLHIHFKNHDFWKNCEKVFLYWTLQNRMRNMELQSIPITALSMHRLYRHLWEYFSTDNDGDDRQ